MHYYVKLVPSTLTYFNIGIQTYKNIRDLSVDSVM